MAAIFESILQGGYTVSFGGLTDSQQHCREFTQTHLSTLLHTRQREKFVREVRVCLCGYGPADEDEPMESNHFSQFQFYLPFTNDVIYFHDKFDFLVLGVANGICKVEEGFEDRYLQALLECMTFRATTVPSFPEHVLDLHTTATPRIVGEVKRSYEESMLLLDSYVKQRHPFADHLRAELAQLEAEQYQVEKKRGEHRSVMGWSREGSPEGDDDEEDEKHRAPSYRAAAMSGGEVGDGETEPQGGEEGGAHRVVEESVAHSHQSPSSRKPKKSSAAQHTTTAAGGRGVDDDASISRIKSELALAQAEAEQAAAVAEQKQDNNKTMPLLSMLLRVQEEQIRHEQLQKQDDAEGVVEAPPTVQSSEL